MHRQAVTPADHEILLTVRGRGVHGAGAGFERDVLAEDDRHLSLEERMLEAKPLEHAAGELTEGAPSRGLDSIALQASLEQLGRHDQPLRAAFGFNFDQRIVELRSHRHPLR